VTATHTHSTSRFALSLRYHGWLKDDLFVIACTLQHFLL